MNPNPIASQDADPVPEPSSATLDPLPGEAGIPSVTQVRRTALSRKGLFAAALLVGSLVAVSAFSLQRFAASGQKDADEDAARTTSRPIAATSAPRKFELPAHPASAAAAGASASVPPAAMHVPALIPTAEELDEAEPIGVHRTGHGAPGATAHGRMRPEDAPIMLVSTRPQGGVTAAAPRGPLSAATAGAPPEEALEGAPPSGSPGALDATARNLEGYQRQLRTLMDTLTRSAALATGQPGAEAEADLATLVPPAVAPRGVPPALGPLSGAAPARPGSLFGGQLQGSGTPRVQAGQLGDRSLTLPKGTAFTCALKTRVVSATSGMVGCQVLRNVFSDDGRVLLIERGSHLDGEYRITSVRPGTVRIPVLWTRIRTPHGITVDIDSPGTGPLGESGIDGYVDNRWGERLGAAMLLSLIDDSVKLIIQDQAARHDGNNEADTIVLPSTTASTSKLAEKVLESTINIPPLIYQNQGGIVGIYVARDVDFSAVYELQPTAGPLHGEGAP